LTDEQRALLKSFEASAGDDTYRDEGFFQRLKSAFR
jgi:hypothetical protein